MSIYEAREQALKDAAARFKRDTEHHEMTVLKDEGMYRHLRFARPDRSGYWFSLTTWPQKLVVNGDVGTYVFSRQEDMFDLIRETAHGGPNFGYWQEKVVASSSPIVDFSTQLFDMQVAETFEEVEAEKHWPGVTAAWDEKVNGCLAEYDTSSEHGARQALNDFTFRPEGAASGDEPFQFYDTWEWELGDYDWKFLWSCHAVLWGVRQYDALKASGGVTVNA